MYSSPTVQCTGQIDGLQSNSWSEHGGYDSHHVRPGLVQGALCAQRPVAQVCACWLAMGDHRELASPLCTYL